MGEFWVFFFGLFCGLLFPVFVVRIVFGGFFVIVFFVWFCVFCCLFCVSFWCWIAFCVVCFGGMFVVVFIVW